MLHLTRVDIVAGFLAATASVVFAGTLGATSVDQFNQMKDGADEAYVLVMAKVAEKVLADAGRPAVALQVQALFTDVPGKGRTEAERVKSGYNSGVGGDEFMEAVDAFTKKAIVSLVTGDPNGDGPFRIEEMMVRELRTHGITLPPAFMAIAKAGRMKRMAALVTPKYLEAVNSAASSRR